MAFSSAILARLRKQWGDLAAQHLQDIFSFCSMEETWVAESYGIEVQECGVRKSAFYPRTITMLYDTIREAWSEFKQDSIGNNRIQISLVVPQPTEATLQSILIFVVSMEPMLHISSPSLVTVLVDEVADDDSLSLQPRHAARVSSPAKKDTLLSLLGLSHYTFPWQYRKVDIWVDNDILSPFRHIPLYNGSLLTIRFGNRNQSILEVARRIFGGENFFARCYAFALQLVGTTQKIHIRVHGIDLQNRPLGHRDLFVTITELCSDRWVDEVLALWPRCPRKAFICLVRKNLHLINLDWRPHVELIVAYSCPVHMAPILIRQDVYIAHNCSAICEEMAVCVHMTCHSSLLQVLAASLPFSFPLSEDSSLAADSCIDPGMPRLREAGDVITFTQLSPGIENYLHVLSSSQQIQKCQRTALERGHSLEYSEI